MPAMPLPDNAVDNAVAKLDGLAADLMNTSGIPGMAVAVVHGGKTVYAKGFGVKDVKAGTTDNANKVDADTVFQLASLSKPLGATVIAHQVGQNAISWDTPVVSKLPWFALSDPVVTRMVTIGDMYAHRSGLPDHAGDELEDLGYDRRYVLDHLRALPLAPFRISYAYTNFGVTAAADAVAAAAGKPWEDLAADVLYRPLGMASTSSAVRRLRGAAEPGGGPYPRRRRVCPRLCPRCRRAGAGRRGEFVGQRHDALDGDDAGQRHLRGPADRRRQSPAARGDSADRVQPGGRTGDAVGVLRLRLQRGNDVGRPHADSATPARSNWVRAPTS